MKYSFSDKSSYYTTLALCIFFAALYGVWLLPETAHIRNICLIGGAVLSLPIIFKNWKYLFQVRAIPILLITLLFLWGVIHLIWIGQEPDLQWIEYKKFWKKILLGAVFALGLGLSIGEARKMPPPNFEIYWKIVYFGLLAPTLIYLAKTILTYLSILYGFSLSPFIAIDRDPWHSPFGIPKVNYVVFCLPVFAVAIGSLTSALRSNQFSPKNSIVYLLTLPMVLLCFYLEGIRNGFIYSTFLLFIALLSISWTYIKSPSFKLRLSTSIIVIATVIIVIIRLSISILQSPGWRSLAADARIAVQLDKYDKWVNRQNPVAPYPLNELGNPVNIQNYERIAWGLKGLDLIFKYPMGYGLMTTSFGQLLKKEFPDAGIALAHSGWIDFTLGYGLPGTLLLFFAALFALFWSKLGSDCWAILGPWWLGSMILLMCTSEVSTEFGIGPFIFLIIFSTALNLNDVNSRSTVVK